ncbi:DUF3168 domain-containing protein [Taklimakanibacter deserti]|uniref:DUF3168 domain-containing protein n=1 Tax=Taklimakanibacter deserti TaxID=2267839 RepID=UPI000E652EB0
MAGSHLFEGWKAVHEALIAANICDGRVLDDPPDDTLFPHIEKGDPAIINDWATGERASTELAATLHVWSRYAGTKECLDIYEQIREALDGKRLSAGAGGQVICYVQGGPIQRDGDGITRHGIVRVILNHQE